MKYKVIIQKNIDFSTPEDNMKKINNNLDKITQSIITIVESVGKLAQIEIDALEAMKK